MTERRWFQVVICLPLLIPGMLLIVASVYGLLYPSAISTPALCLNCDEITLVTNHIMSLFKVYPSWITFGIGIPFIMSGVQYAVFVGVLWWWSSRESVKEPMRAIVLLPFGFVPFLLVGLLIAIGVDAKDLSSLKTGRFVQIGAIIAMVAVIYSYAYVILGLILTAVVRRLGYIVPEQPAQP